MTERYAIETEGLTKRYGKKTIVRELNLRVRPGEVYALVGPNGAGKTTVIRLVAGLAFPTSGRVRLLGENPATKPAVRRRMGAVVQAPAAFYPYLTGFENLELHARLAGNVPEARIYDLLDLMELGEAGHRRVGIYSLGMRQRLGVAAALLTQPEVLILDEPASGMDPLSLHLVHGVLKAAAEGGTAVLISTHHLEEVVKYCTRVGILDEGGLLDEIELFDQRERYRARVSSTRRAYDLLARQPFIRQVGLRRDEVVFVLSDATALGQVATLLVGDGIEVLELSRETFDLRAYYEDRLSRERVRVWNEAHPETKPAEEETRVEVVKEPKAQAFSTATVPTVSTGSLAEELA